MREIMVIVHSEVHVGLAVAAPTSVCEYVETPWSNLRCHRYLDGSLRLF